MPILSTAKNQLSQSPTELSKVSSQKRATTAPGSITPDVYGNISRRNAIKAAMEKGSGSAAANPHMSSKKGQFTKTVKADPKIGRGQKNASKTAG